MHRPGEGVSEMLGFLKRKPAASSGRTVEVGWIIDADKASFIWEAPQRLSRNDDPKMRHAKSVRVCPAVTDHEARLFEVPCPIDLHLRIELSPEGGEPKVINAAGDQSTIRSKALQQMFTVVSRKEWRHPQRPVVQIMTPYLFLADEQVFLSQLPPFAHYRSDALPGVLIGGRMPIHIWPRPMMWAFEWHEPARDLVLKRGEPWFYVRFETPDPSRAVRLVECEVTPPLRNYLDGLSGVANYVNRTFSLFSTAKERRPLKLMSPVKR
ncbi:hypothetical protein [Bosea sp. (in: a-proteobacteria)]|jgi:hypothetical protein|uniref:hypothetical protein n=1 Tax=Bosea sp. (in: a-proteobacteria) TaxID=1871050 RepID=UPI003F6E665E